MADFRDEHCLTAEGAEFPESISDTLKEREKREISEIDVTGAGIRGECQPGSLAPGCLDVKRDIFRNHDAR